MKNKSYQKLAVVLCLFGFVACGDAENTTQTEKQKVSQKINANIKVTGALNGTLSGNAMIFCTRDGIFSLHLSGDKEIFSLNFPRDIAIGEHKYEEEQYKSPLNAITIIYQDTKHGARYSHGKGIFNISAIPTKKGERFAATVKAQMQDKDNSIDLEADIDMVAGYQSFDECQ